MDPTHSAERVIAGSFNEIIEWWFKHQSFEIGSWRMQRSQMQYNPQILLRFYSSLHSNRDERFNSYNYSTVTVQVKTQMK